MNSKKCAYNFYSKTQLFKFFLQFFFWKNVRVTEGKPKKCLVFFLWNAKTIERLGHMYYIFLQFTCCVCTLYVHNDGLVNNQNQSFGFGDIHQQSRLNESVPVFGQWLKIGKSKTIS